MSNNYLHQFIKYSINSNFKKIDNLVEHYNYSIFTKINGVSCFDIFVQRMVNKNFKNKKKIVKFLKKHSERELVNLKDMLFESPLIGEINKKKPKFYSKLKNILMTLHTIEKSKINYQKMSTELCNAFEKNPKDGISLIKFLLKKKIMDQHIKVSELCKTMIISPKIFNWMLNNFEKPFTKMYFSGIIYIFLRLIAFNEINTDQTEKYFNIFKTHKRLFLNNNDNNNNNHNNHNNDDNNVNFNIVYSEIVYMVINDTCNDLNNLNDYDKFNFTGIQKILTRFEEIFGFSLSGDKVKLFIMNLNDARLKFYVTYCFKSKISELNRSEKIELYNDFLLGLPKNYVGLMPLIRNYLSLIEKIREN